MNALQDFEPVTAATGTVRRSSKPVAASNWTEPGEPATLVYFVRGAFSPDPSSVAFKWPRVTVASEGSKANVLFSQQGLVEFVAPAGLAVGQTIFLSGLLTDWPAAYDPTTARLTAAVATLVPDNVFERLTRQLDGFAALEPDWDSNDSIPPNAVAIENCRRVLTAAETLGFPPTRLFAASGSVFAYFSNGQKYGDVECDNDGSVLIVISDRTAAPKAWASTTANLKTDLLEIRAFLI